MASDYINQRAVDPTDNDNDNVNGNYASAARDFVLAPPAGEKWSITRLLVYIEDGGSMDSGGYGNNGGNELTNGVKIILQEDDEESEVATIKTNGEWAAQCYDANYYDYGAGNTYLVVRWTFSKAGDNIILQGNRGDRIILRVNDNLSYLVKHYFTFQGNK